MVSSSVKPAARYRRRILGLGALATGALYVIGAPIFNDRIETDLERRVPIELDAAGFSGLTASFSGQDGVLTCTAPLDDPEGARAAAYDVKGVRAIELDRSCRVNAAAVPTEEVSEEPSADDAAADPAVADTTVVDSAPSTTTPSTEVGSELATVNDIVAANPDLAFFAVLLADADIGRSDEPITLFAPENEAFDAIPSDVLGRLQNDPALLSELLSHHVVAAVLRTSDLLDGDLTALDGNALTVRRAQGDGGISVGGASIVQADIAASNGVVHVIDGVLLPPDIDLNPVAALAPAAATFDGAGFVLSGVAASEVERQVVVAAAVAVAGVDGVIDEMTVDPDTGLESTTAADLATLIAAMPANLLSGESGFNGTSLYANGIPRSATDGEAFAAAALAVDVQANLMPRPEATDEDVADLEAELNVFVAENPILFEPSSAVLTASAFAVIDRLATDALRFDGIKITVEGHTDSDGVPIDNLQLSQNRAAAVASALIERGVAADAVEATGFGSEQPIVVNGVEDKAASRRVEFRVVTAS